LGSSSWWSEGTRAEEGLEEAVRQDTGRLWPTPWGMADIIGTANVLKSCSKRPYDIVLKLGNSSRWSSSNTKITAADNYVGAGAPKGDSRLRGGGFQNRVFSFFPSF
jgi:hypothetical protein